MKSRVGSSPQRIAPKATHRVLDISKVEFIHHRVLLALNDLAGKDGTVRPFGANGLARVWQRLDLASPALGFC